MNHRHVFFGSLSNMALFRRIFSHRPLSLAEQQATLCFADNKYNIPFSEKVNFENEAIIMVNRRVEFQLTSCYLYGDLFLRAKMKFCPLIRTSFCYDALGQHVDFHKTDYATYLTTIEHRTFNVVVPNNVKPFDIIVTDELQ